MESKLRSFHEHSGSPREQVFADVSRLAATTATVMNALGVCDMKWTHQTSEFFGGVVVKTVDQPVKLVPLAEMGAP